MSNHRNRSLPGIVAGGLAALTLLGAACGDDDPSDAGAVEAPVTTTAPADADDTSTLTIETTDFSFGDLPDEVAAGTTVELTNASSVEVHEAVVFRLADGEDRPVEEILATADPADPLALGELVGVGVALPGEEALYPEGPVLLDEPGRYLIACFIPTGADPAVYAEAIEAGAPPEGLTGEPHVAHGMFDEVTVR